MYPFRGNPWNYQYNPPPVFNPVREVKLCLDLAAKNSNSDAIPILEEARKICDNYGSHFSYNHEVYLKLTHAYLAQSKYVCAASTADILVALNYSDFQAYDLRGTAYSHLPYKSSSAIKDFIKCYTISNHNVKKALCKAIMVAVDTGLEEELNLNDLIRSRKECMAILNALVYFDNDHFRLKSRHLKYLLVPTSSRGSGIAVQYFCDHKYTLKWSHIIKTKDFDIETMEAIISVGGHITVTEIKAIITSVHESKEQTLHFALDNCKTSLNSKEITCLGVAACKSKKITFLSMVLMRDGIVDREDIYNNFLPSTIFANKATFNYVIADKKGVQKLIKLALEQNEFDFLEKNKDNLLPSSNCTVDISTLIKSCSHGTSEVKKKCVEFIISLLDDKIVSADGIEGELIPLDTVLEFPKNCNKQKIKLIGALLKNGANIQRCTYARKEQTTILHSATQIAIDESDASLLEIVCDYFPFSELTDLADKQGNTPYHLVMEHKSSPTTIKICEILCNWPINPSSANQRGKKPGEKWLGTQDVRLSILKMAEQKCQSQKTSKKKSKSSRKRRSKNDAPENGEKLQTTLESSYQDIRDPNKDNVTLSIAEMSNDQVMASVKTNIKNLSQCPSSHFEPQANESKTHKEQICSTTEEVSMATIPVQKETKTTNDSETQLSTAAPQNSVDNVNILEKFDGCAWEVECTDSVKKFLSDEKIPRKWKDAVLNKMLQIANGIPIQNRKLCGELRSSIPGLKLYETKFSKQGRIIWQIAIQFSSRLTNTSAKQHKSYMYSEVIRIWDVEPYHDRLNRTIDHIVKSISHGETASKPVLLAIAKARKRKLVKGEERLLLPNLYQARAVELAESDSEKPQFLPAGSPRENEYNVSTFYSVDNAFIRSMLEGGESRRDFPFKEWPKEHDIINMAENKESILLLGRSGTGKTTCCLYRLWNQFNTYWLQATLAGPLLQHIPLNHFEAITGVDEDDAISNYDGEITETSLHTNKPELCESESDSKLEHLHQIFITKNYVLCSQMKKRFYDMAAGRAVSKEHLKYEDEDTPKRLSEVNDFSFPLFLTARQFFILLDNSLEDNNQFFPRDEDGNLTVKILSSDYDHEDPDTLHDLEESDSEAEYEEDIEGTSNTSSKRQINEKAMHVHKEVTASFFVQKIWPYICKNITLAKKSKLDPLLVWMEIKSFIKGSINSVNKKEGHLSRETYKLLGKKIASNYKDKRDEIYDLFIQYDNYLKHHSEEDIFDECDLIASLYTRLNSAKTLSWSIHGVYVDEVQDFTQAELAILLKVCRNPNNLFLTGDTAQSIMRGISFRFKELKYLFHFAKKQTESRARAPTITMPDVKLLEINFRSHTGVLKLAASIIDLMKRFFPSSFDFLPEDEGMFKGPKPIVLDSCMVSDLALVMRSNKRESSVIEFGAHQVIIVQSEEAKKNIPDVLRAGIVLTVFEAKGLEFDDVLLYDFFKYSQVNEEWQVVSESKGESDDNKKDEDIDHPFGIPRCRKFDEAQHKSLNPELKYLYTAITRAKCHLWIYDSDQNKRLPMFDYWYKRNLIKIVKVSEMTEQEQQSLFADKSDSEEWKSQGDYFKKKNLWEAAAKCYHKASCADLELEALGYNFVQQARQSVHDKVSLYIKAALAFLESDKLKNNFKCLQIAAICLKNAKKYSDAAKMYIFTNNMPKASSCAHKSGDLEVLAKLKSRKGDHNGAIHTLLKNGHIIEALQHAAAHESELSEIYKVSYIAHKEAKRLLKQSILSDFNTVKLFEGILKYLSPLDRVEYLKKAHMLDKACEILEAESDYDGVLRIYVAQGWFKEGIVLSKEQNRNSHKNIFVWLKASQEIQNGKMEASTANELQRMSGIKTNDEIKSEFLRGIAYSNKFMLKNARDYYYRKNNLGFLEALHFSTKGVEYNSTSHTWNNIHLSQRQDFFDLLLDGIIILQKLLEKLKSSDQSSVIGSIIDFYGFERTLEKDDTYIIPESSYLWTNELMKNKLFDVNSIDRDSDGFMKIHLSYILKAIIDRLESFRNSWIIADKFNAIEIFSSKLQSVSFHEKIIKSGGYLTALHYDQNITLPHYLQLLCTAFEFFDIGSSKISFNVLQAIINAISPQASQCIPIEILKSAQQKSLKLHNPKVCSELSSRFPIQGLVGNSFNFDKWLEHWRIYCLIESGANKELTKLLKSNGQKNAGNVYVFDNQDKSYKHIFLVWLNSSTLIVKMKPFSASTIFVHNIIRYLANHQTISGTLSLSNLLNISTVHAVAILTMRAICVYRMGYSGDLYILRSYHNISKVFMVMVGGDSLFEACLNDMKERASASLQNVQLKLYNLLRMMLESLIGQQNSEFNPLYNAAVNETSVENGETESFIAFIFVLFGNLALIGLPDDELETLRYQICCCISNCNSVLIKKALERFSISSTLAGCFGAVRDLLEPSKDILEHVQIYNENHTKISAKANPAELMKMMTRRLNPIDFASYESKAVKIVRPSLSASAKPFYPTGIEPEDMSSTSDKLEPVEASIEDISPEVVMTSQVSISDEITLSKADEHPMVDRGFCRICACPLQPDTMNPIELAEDDEAIQIGEVQRYSEHCQSKSHKDKIRLYESFQSEVNDVKLMQGTLREKSEVCQAMSLRDTELKKLEKIIRKILKEYDYMCSQIEQSGEWKNGLHQIDEFKKSMKTLVDDATFLLDQESQKEKKLNEQVQQEEIPVEEELDDIETEEIIPDTNTNPGEMSRRNVRIHKKKKHHRNKLKKQ